MAYIYQITNDVNGKVYIGKTEFSIEKRFQEHCKDAFKNNDKNRPLYAAMRKYGIEHFHIEAIEQTDSPEEREKFWIEKKGSFINGYNATIGGDGKAYLDYAVLIETYKQTNNLKKTADICGCDNHHLSEILKAHQVEVLSHTEVSRKQFSKVVNQYSLQGEYIQSFSSSQDAARSVRPESKNIYGVAGHITDVCRGKRKTAYGFIWRFPS